MPTKRVRRAHVHQVPDAELQRFHVLTGDCLLAGEPPHGCHCGLRRPDGTEDEDAWEAARKRLGIPEGDGDAHRTD